MQTQPHNESHVKQRLISYFRQHCKKAKQECSQTYGEFHFSINKFAVHLIRGYLAHAG